MIDAKEITYILGAAIIFDLAGVPVQVRYVCAVWIEMKS